MPLRGLIAAMASNTIDLGSYVADFQRFDEEVGRGDVPWLRRLREQAIARFQEVGFPAARRGNEAWKYTSVAGIARGGFRYPFEANETPSASMLKGLALNGSGALLVFVDGAYSLDLSSANPVPTRAIVSDLVEALQRDPDGVSRNLGSLAELNGDGFTALSTAFIHHGALVLVPAGMAPEPPLQILHLSTGTVTHPVTHPRALIVIEDGAEATVIESYHRLAPGPSFTNAVTEVVLGEGSILKYYRVAQEGDGASHVGRTEVRQGRDSRFKAASLSLGGQLLRHNLNVRLEAPGAEADLDGLYVTSGQEHVDNATFVDHQSPHTSSRQLYKGLVAGQSHAVFSGRVLVRPNAQKTDAHQVNRNLVLSAGAEVDTKPHLEIFADDVRCTHGATAGKLDDQALFYLRARGLDQLQARDILAHAFAREVIDRIGLRSLQARVGRSLARKLAGLDAGVADGKRPEAVAAGRAG